MCRCHTNDSKRPSWPLFSFNPTLTPPRKGNSYSSGPLPPSIQLHQIDIICIQLLLGQHCYAICIIHCKRNDRLSLNVNNLHLFYVEGIDDTTLFNLPNTFYPLIRKKYKIWHSTLSGKRGKKCY